MTFSLHSKPMIASALLVAISLATPSSAQVGRGGRFAPPPPPTPPKYVPGAPTLIASPGMVVDVATGTTYTTYTNCGTGPIANAVAFALRMAQPSDVVGVLGTHPVIFFVPNQNPCRQNEVSWGNGGIVHDVDVVGLDSTARIDRIFIKGDYTQPGQGGIDRVTFQGLTFFNDPDDRTAVESVNNGRQGLMRIYDCLFDAADPSAWGGKGMKFGMRMHLMSLDLRGNHFLTGAQEHLFYIDSPGFDGAYNPSLIVIGNTTSVPSGRTSLQVVNRINPVGGSSYVGAPGKGLILIRSNTFEADAKGGGGSTVTIAGHHGKVWIHKNRITQTGGAGGAVDTGGVTVWDSPGTWLLGNGFATKSVFVVGNVIKGNGTRANISVCATEFVWIGNNTFNAAGDGVSFDSCFGLGIPNGTELLPFSGMAGWQQGGCKARDDLGAGSVCLTDHQIDTLY